MKKFLFFLLVSLVSCTNIDEPRCWEITISYSGKGNDSATTYFYGTERQIREQAKDWLEAGQKSEVYKTKLKYKKAKNNLCNN